MNVTEVFVSIQGESTLQGIPSVFVRLTSCNLNCSYCDSRYARDSGADMTRGELLKKVDSLALSHICVTGGEPLLQEETPLLIAELIEREFVVSIETNGTIDASQLHHKTKRIIDIKCPGSGEAGKTDENNLTEIRPSDEFKCVITGREDFDYACDFIKSHDTIRACTILFSPAWHILEPSLLSAWIIDEMPGVRLNLPLHKYIWPDVRRGK